MSLEGIWPWILWILGILGLGSTSLITVTFAIDPSNPLIFSAFRLVGKAWRHVVMRKYFIAAPMTVTASDEEYTRVFEQVIAIKNGLKSKTLFIFPLKIDVQSAVLDAPSKRDFRPAREGFEIAARRIKRCDYFVLLYPSAKPSSTLVETGIAVGFRKPIAAFYKRGEDLPYVLREAQAATVAGARFKAYQIDNLEDLVRRVSRGHKYLFADHATSEQRPSRMSADRNSAIANG